MIAGFGAPIRGYIRAVGYKQEPLPVRRKGRVPVLVMSGERDRHWFSPAITNPPRDANGAIVGHVYRLSVRHKRRRGLLIWSGNTILHKNGRFSSLSNGKACLAKAAAGNKAAE